ncbi:MAG: beta-ketoacyl-ACP synthase [Rubrivivax sp.]|nr:beta-ketoacyl-ACP synthase [Rubrivivax sp.]
MASLTAPGTPAAATPAGGATAAPPAPIVPISVAAFSSACAAGIGNEALAAALLDGRTRLAPNHFGEPCLQTCVGAVAALDAPGAAQRLPASLARWDARATRLAWLGLVADDFLQAARAAVARCGAARVGLALGTSASTIGVTEAAYRALASDGGFPPALRDERLNTPHAVAMFVAEVLGIAGPVVTVSTACSSSAKVFATAERWLRLGLVDAVVAGGVDALSQSVLWGFASLGLVSPTPCRPFDRRRDGISIGEAAGFALLQRAADGPVAAGARVPRLLGHGEASDAFHMSSPHPEGLGAQFALDAALARAGLAGSDVDYVNLHGTASARNDEVEAALLARRYGPRTLASATKGLTGHTMGAAGMLEAVICLLALQQGLVPGTTGLEEPDAAGDARLVRAPRRQALRTAASHSFGFGGSNAVLVFGRGA